MDLPSLPLHTLYPQPPLHTASCMAEHSTRCTAVWSIGGLILTLSISFGVPVVKGLPMSVGHVRMYVCMFVCMSV